MLPSIQHGMKSRVSLYNVIPPIGASIHNFRNRDEKLWTTLQRIREMEKAASEQNSPHASSPMRALNCPLGVQDSNFVETSLNKTQKGKNNITKNEKMAHEKFHDLFDVPSSPSDSEVEFSIALDNVHQFVFRYSSSDQESSDDKESLSVRVPGNSMRISSPDNSFKDEAIQTLEGKMAGESLISMEK